MAPRTYALWTCRLSLCTSQLILSVSHLIATCGPKLNFMLIGVVYGIAEMGTSSLRESLQAIIDPFSVEQLPTSSKASSRFEVGYRCRAIGKFTRRLICTRLLDMAAWNLYYTTTRYLNPNSAYRWGTPGAEIRACIQNT